MKFNFNGRCLKAASFAMSEEIQRPNIYGLHISARNGKVCYQATDGRHIIRVVDLEADAPDGLSFMMPRWAVKEALPIFARERTRYEAKIKDEWLGIFRHDAEYSYKAADAVFPKTAKFFDELEPQPIEYIGADLGFFAGMAQSLQALDRPAQVKIQFNKTNQEAFLLSINACDFEWNGVIMPCRV